jgi:hypothetical protein
MVKTLCRDAAKDFSCISFATNLMPLRGEGFFIGFFLL